MSMQAETEAMMDRLIAFPTVSSDSNLDMISYVATRLEDIGARVWTHVDPTGQKASLFASLGPERDGGLMLSGHTDVVPVTDQVWTSDPFEMKTTDDRLFGRGTCDMKGFIAACLTLAPSWSQIPLTRPVHFSFTYDEEVGCLGARALVPEITARGIAPATALIGEPTDMRVIEGHKGCCEYTTRFTGLEGHGSAPDKGVNAVIYAMRYANRLLELAQDLRQRPSQDLRYDPPWSSVNIGRLSGGSVHNVIPGLAELDWEMRPVSWQDADYVNDALRHYVDTTLLPAMRAIAPGANITTEIIGEVVGLSARPENAIRDLIFGLTGQNTADLVPFGTEAGLFQDMGMDVVVCGPGSIAQAHKPDEYLERAQIQPCLDLLNDLVRRQAS